MTNQVKQMKVEQEEKKAKELKEAINLEAIKAIIKINNVQFI